MSKPRRATVPGRSRTPEHELRSLPEASNLEGQPLCEPLRREGLLEPELVQWRKDATAGLARTAGKPSPEARALAVVRRELARKERPLAEASALTMQRADRELAGRVHGDVAPPLLAEPAGVRSWRLRRSPRAPERNSACGAR